MELRNINDAQEIRKDGLNLNDKMQLKRLMVAGKSPKEIAKILLVKDSVVKTFCKFFEKEVKQMVKEQKVVNPTTDKESVQEAIAQATKKFEKKIIALEEANKKLVAVKEQLEADIATMVAAIEQHQADRAAKAAENK